MYYETIFRRAVARFPFIDRRFSDFERVVNINQSSKEAFVADFISISGDEDGNPSGGTVSIRIRKAPDSSQPQISAVLDDGETLNQDVSPIYYATYNIKRDAWVWRTEPTHLYRSKREQYQISEKSE